MVIERKMENLKRRTGQTLAYVQDISSELVRLVLANPGEPVRYLTGFHTRAEIEVILSVLCEVVTFRIDCLDLPMNSGFRKLHCGRGCGVVVGYIGRHSPPLILAYCLNCTGEVIEAERVRSGKSAEIFLDELNSLDDDGS